MIKQIIADNIRALCFQGFKPDPAHRRSYFLYGFLITWLVGVGRYWDHPSAHWWQYAGLGSLAYIFILTALLWILIAPLRPKRWLISDICLFLMFTAAPALLYAIPVERMMPMMLAQSANALFLFVIAMWRVALLIHFLYKYAQLNVFRIAIGTLLPIMSIICVLSMLNLEQAVFEIMAGNDRASTPYDAAYQLVWVLSLFSMLGLPIVLFFYITALIASWIAYREEKEAGEFREATNKRAEAEQSLVVEEADSSLS